MELHRIFIAINLPEDMKRELLLLKEKWAEVPAKWTIEDNLHITLAFLGNVSDKELEEIIQIAEQTTKGYSPFSFSFTRVQYGPLNDTPRMIWLLGENSQELLELQEGIQELLQKSPSIHFNP